MNGSMRFPPIPPGAMSAEQRSLAQSYRAGWRASIAAADGALGGPFDATLRSPELARRLAGVSDYFRSGTCLPPRIKEFAILVVAREWRSAFEWHAHCALALQAGVTREVMHDLCAGGRPAAMSEQETQVYEVITGLQRDRRLGEACFERARAILGERALVELVGLCGYYTLVAMMLAVADVQPPGPPDAGLPTLEQGG